MKSYRNEGNRDVGLHYAQCLFDRLHKKSWCKGAGTSKKALCEPSKEVLESLRLTYPRVQKVASQPASKGSPKGERKGSPKGAWGGQGYHYQKGDGGPSSRDCWTGVPGGPMTGVGSVPGPTVVAMVTAVRGRTKVVRRATKVGDSPS